MIKKIVITKGVGSGKTELAAFDDALMSAGIANYNLIHLSSIIPPGAKIYEERPEMRENEYGDRLYVVLAEMRQSEPGKLACAGLGWIIAEDGSGRGIFVEHVGESEEIVLMQIKNSLQSMTESRGGGFGEIHHMISSIGCTDSPVSALVAGVYRSDSW